MSGKSFRNNEAVILGVDECFPEPLESQFENGIHLFQKRWTKFIPTTLEIEINEQLSTITTSSDVKYNLSPNNYFLCLWKRKDNLL